MPEDVRFATKPARAMIAQALDAGVPCAWVLALDGSDKSLMLEDRRKPPVLAVRSNEKFMAVKTAAQMADAVPPAAWRRFPAGEGTKGLRLYDWARRRLERLQDGPFEHGLLVRRSGTAPSERAYDVVFAPRDTTRAELAGVAGLRWTIEACFERAKNDLGLDHCEARSWHGWHRHVTLCMAALAFLTKLAAELRNAVWDKPNETSPAEPIAA